MTVTPVYAGCLLLSAPASTRRLAGMATTTPGGDVAARIPGNINRETFERFAIEAALAFAAGARYVQVWVAGPDWEAGAFAMFDHGVTVSPWKVGWRLAHGTTSEVHASREECYAAAALLVAHLDELAADATPAVAS